MGYRMMYALTYAVSLLPYRVLYVLSDGVFLLVFYLIRYRRKVVRHNLRTSFPDRSQEELRRIERRFYHWLCDYFLETVKLLTVSTEELLRHIEFRNTDEVEKYFDQGRPCAAMLGHYCNWEYLSTTGLAMKRHKDAVMGLIYHPLRNKAFDRLFLDIRQGKGGTCIPKRDILRHLISYKRDNRMSLMGYIADQGPKWENIHLWLPFLNHDTPVFTGAERIIRKMDNAVFYARIQRPERGKYICTFQLMTDHPKDEDEYAVTRDFFRRLEKDIQEDPAFYLWTHKRWKRTHEEYDKLIKEGKIKR